MYAPREPSGHPDLEGSGHLHMSLVPAKEAAVSFVIEFVLVETGPDWLLVDYLY